MGLFNKLESKLQSVTNAAKSMSQKIESFAQDSEERTEETGRGETNISPRYESLRPLLRTVLMKNEVTDKDRELLKRKAVALGMDGDEFELLFDGMVSARKKYAYKALLGKEVSYAAFFGDEFELEDGNAPFDTYFEATFYSDKEKQTVKVRRAKEDADELKGLSGLVNLLG